MDNAECCITHITLHVLDNKDKGITQPALPSQEMNEIQLCRLQSSVRLERHWYVGSTTRLAADTTQMGKCSNNKV